MTYEEMTDVITDSDWFNERLERERERLEQERLEKNSDPLISELEYYK